MFDISESTPKVQPKLAATIILVRDTDQGLEVLITRRNKNSNFLGGFWVFPGGAVEDVDQGDEPMDTLKNAAIRETMEEAGLAVDKDELLYISQWITPEGAPKRFDTHFFVVPATRQEVVVDGAEIVDHEWVTAKNALEKYQNSEIDMMPPTLLCFLALSECDSVEAVIKRYQAQTPYSFAPKPCFNDNVLVMLYPGDAGYESADPDANGAQHRCELKDGRWCYINEVNFKP